MLIRKSLYKREENQCLPNSKPFLVCGPIINPILRQKKQMKSI
jgi:hypothetical protein